MRAEHYTRPPPRRRIHGLSPTTPSPPESPPLPLSPPPALEPHRRRLDPPVLTRALDPEAPAAPRELTDLELEADRTAQLHPIARRQRAAQLAAQRRSDLELYCRIVREVFGTVIDPAQLGRYDELLIELEAMATA